VSLAIRHLAIFASFLLSQAVAFALTDTNADSIPPLRSPHGEIGPGLWEQQRSTVVIGGAVLAVCLVVATWWIRRPRETTVIPPDIQARDALKPLLAEREDGALLSRVSQILRKYFSASFELTPGEVTTTEFCRMIIENEKIGPDLARPISDFLRLCDARKFAPSAPGDPLQAVTQALKLIELAETRRKALKIALVSNGIQRNGRG
jgi:hypothetical protein